MKLIMFVLKVQISICETNYAFHYFLINICNVLTLKSVEYWPGFNYLTQFFSINAFKMANLVVSFTLEKFSVLSKLFVAVRQ